jgi:hypothetical protein
MTSATARIAANTCLSAGPPRPPEVPLASVAAPSTDEIMLASTHGRPSGAGRASAA